MRTGLSPIVGTVLMAAVLVSLGTGAFVYLTDIQDEIVGQTQPPDLRTVNVTCGPYTVDWWIANEGDERVDDLRPSVFISQAGTINTTLSEQALLLPEPIARPDSRGKLTISPAGRLTAGTRYDIELDFDQYSTETSCTVGTRWWNDDWRFRRTVSRQVAGPFTANITLPADRLQRRGYLRPDCGDLRPVHDGDLLPHRVGRCGANATLHVNVSQVRPALTYVYYGNLQAQPAATPLRYGPNQSIGLRPVERLGLD